MNMSAVEDIWKNSSFQLIQFGWNQLFLFIKITNLPRSYYSKSNQHGFGPIFFPLIQPSLSPWKCVYSDLPWERDIMG